MILGKGIIMRVLKTLVLVAVLFSSTAAFAGFDEGKHAYDTKNWTQAILNLRPLAESKDPRAMVLLGNMYAQGYGVSADPVEAFNLYLSAARLGNVDGAISVATMYQKGTGTTVNTFLSIAWFERAAKMGSQLGAFFYGVHMFQGAKSEKQDIKPDHAEAYFWFRRAGLGASPRIAVQANAFADKLSATIDPAVKSEKDEQAKNFTPVAFTDLPPPP